MNAAVDFLLNLIKILLLLAGIVTILAFTITIAAGFLIAIHDELRERRAKRTVRRRMEQRRKERA